MPLSWNEIKSRAVEFSKEWENETRENAEAKSFWDGFFKVFGIKRRKIGIFEKHVQKLGNKEGFIDLFWPGTLLVEHKSRGKNLDKAFEQASDYFEGLKDYEYPKYILISDFNKFRLYDLEEGTEKQFNLKNLVDNVQLFDFIAGYEKRTYKESDPVNIEAAELMGKLHDRLKENGYDGHNLEVYLVRLLFCLFADDTGIFEKDIFLDFIQNRTSSDGSDLASKLTELFQILNTPEDKRPKTLDESLSIFPYINGKLFEEQLLVASFDKKMRRILFESCYLDWGKVSPAIFGSLFQSVMDSEHRRNLGAHYTSEKNILKLINPLFMDELWIEFNKIKNNINKLKEFQNKISNFKFFDPACGCGNFLIIAYRELRLLEIEIIKIYYSHADGDIQQSFHIQDLSRIDVDNFYGIEIEEFPARIAEVSMWMMDHLMNRELSLAIGHYYTRLPLKNAANITNDNALSLNWNNILLPTNNVYLLGNPPFSGSRYQTKKQKSEMKTVFKGVKNQVNLIMLLHGI
jgi:type II restriction/modification system DNA methylase subunit YeeA